MAVQDPALRALAAQNKALRSQIEQLTTALDGRRRELALLRQRSQVREIATRLALNGVLGSRDVETFAEDVLTRLRQAAATATDSDESEEGEGEAVVDLSELRLLAGLRRGRAASPPGATGSPTADETRASVWQAAAAGDLEGVRRWLEEDGCCVDAKDPASNGCKGSHQQGPRGGGLGGGKTPLYCAVAAGQLEVARYLLAQGGNSDCKCKLPPAESAHPWSKLNPR